MARPARGMAHAGNAGCQKTFFQNLYIHICIAVRRYVVLIKSGMIHKSDVIHAFFKKIYTSSLRLCILDLIQIWAHGWGNPLLFFVLCLEPPEPPKNLPKKPPEPPKNIPKPEPSKHPFFFSTTCTKKIREHFLFGTIKKSGNISKTQWCLDHLNRNSLLLTFLVDHMKIWSKHPFKG